MVCRSGPKAAGSGYMGSDEANPRFSNWNGNVAFTPDLLRRPTDLPSLVETVSAATEQGQSLHVIGSGWSYGDCPSADNVMVCLSDMVPSSGTSPQINYVVQNGNVLTDEWNSQQEFGTHKLVHYPAGIKLSALVADLASHALTLPTMGGSNGQALGGAISTSVHGGDWQQPPLCEIVQAVHLIGAGGQEFWIESASKPLTRHDRNNAALLGVLPCSTTKVIRDDNVFNAVRVACGRFGVIYSVVLAVVPQFRVVQLVTNPSKDSVLAALRSGQGSMSLFTPLLRMLALGDAAFGLTDAVGVPYFFQIMLNSQRPTDVWVTRRWTTPSIAAGGLPDLRSSVDATGDTLNALRQPLVALAQAALLGAALPTAGVASAIGAGVAGALLGPLGSLLVTGWSAQAASSVTQLCVELTALLVADASLGEIAAAAVNALWQVPGAGYAVADIEKMLIDSNIPGGKKSRGFYADITAGAPASYYKADSIEVVFDAATGDYLDFLDEILAIAPVFPQAGYISVRPSLPSTALLSMHNVSSRLRTVSIEVASLKDLAGNGPWMWYVEQRAIAHNGRPHWGQMNTLDAHKVAMMYTGLNEWREALYRVNGAAPVFSNAYSRQRGLEPEGIIRRVTCVVVENGAITHLGNGGQYWSPIPLHQAVDEIILGRVIYVAQLGNNVPVVLSATRHGRIGGGFMLDVASVSVLQKLPTCHYVKAPTVEAGPVGFPPR